MPQPWRRVKPNIFGGSFASASHRWGPSWAQTGSCRASVPIGAAKTYFLSPTGIDENGGISEAAPAENFAAVRDRLRPGDVVRLLRGTYALTKPLSINGSGGTPEAPITVEGECADTVLDGSAIPMASNDKPAVYIGNARHIVLRNMVIENRNSFAVYVENSDGVAVSDIEARNSFRNGIWVNASADVRISNAYVHDTVLENADNARVRRHHDALWRQAIGFARTSDSAVENSRVENNWGEGIDFIGRTPVAGRGEKNNSARGNLVRNNYSVGLYFDNMRDSTFENNIVVADDPTYFRCADSSCAVRQPASGIAIADEAGDRSRTNSGLTIRNNIVVGALNGIYYGSYGFGYGLRRAVIAHNTVVDAVVDVRIDPPKAGFAHSDSMIANNLFSGPAKNHSAAMVPITAGLSFAHNLWFGGGSGRVTAPRDFYGKNRPNPPTIGALEAPLK